MDSPSSLVDCQRSTDWVSWLNSTYEICDRATRFKIAQIRSSSTKLRSAITASGTLSAIPSKRPIFMLTSIALITTVYNRAPFLAQTLDSILAQTYPHFELLIWDDGSTDGSVDIAQHYARLDPRVRLIAFPSNQGLSVSLKSAIAATSGQYLGWVDSDDLLAPTALEATVAVLEEFTDVGLVYTNYNLIDEQGRDCGLGKLCRTPYSKEQLLVDFMTFHFRLIRRSVYDRVGGVDDSLASAEDYDLCLKLSEVTEIYHLAGGALDMGI